MVVGALAASPLVAAGPITGEQAVEGAGRISRALATFAVRRALKLSRQQRKMMRFRHPDIPVPEIERAIEIEREREVTFASKMETRVKKDIEEALKLSTSEERQRRLRQILDRERRYARMREEAMTGRLEGAANVARVKRDSPDGAYWMLSERPVDHCAVCSALAGHVWTWDLLDKLHPPLHPNCYCILITLDSARRGNLITDADIPRTDEQKRENLRRGIALVQALRHGDHHGVDLSLTEAPRLPDGRDRRGWSDIRYAKGLEKGGQFAPKRGGSSAAARGREKFEKSAKAVQRGRGNWHWLEGRRVFVPQDRDFERTIAGRTYASPKGTAEVTVDGTPVDTGVPVSTGGDLELPVAEIPQSRLRELTRVLGGLRDRRTPRGKTSTPTNLRLSDSSPKDFQEYARESFALAYHLGDHYNAPVKISAVTPSARPDHAGFSAFDGSVEVGRDVAPGIANDRDLRAAGKALGYRDLAQVFGNYKVQAHEVSHTVNPASQAEYADVANAQLEEALTEEVAHVLAIENLARHEREDVISWYRANPHDVAVAGSYRDERARLATVLDRAGVPPEEREQVVTDLKFRTRPADRMAALSELAMQHGRELAPAEIRSILVNSKITGPTRIIAPHYQGVAVTKVGARVLGLDINEGARVRYSLPGQPTRSGTVERIVDHGAGRVLWTTDDSTGQRVPLAPEYVRDVLAVKGSRSLNSGGHAYREGDKIEYHAGGTWQPATITQITRGQRDYIAEAIRPDGQPVILTRGAVGDLRPGAEKITKKIKARPSRRPATRSITATDSGPTAPQDQRVAPPVRAAQETEALQMRKAPGSTALTTRWNQDLDDIRPGAKGVLQKMAARAGVDVDTYQNDQTATLARLARNSEVAVRFRQDKLERILDEGYRGNPLHSRGAKYGRARKRMEEHFFGDTPIAYGYLATDAEDLDSGLGGFGTSKITLKPSVRDRTTVMYSDSMYVTPDNLDESPVVPQPIDNPTYLAVHPALDFGPWIEKPVLEKGDQPRPIDMPPELARREARRQEILAEWEAEGNPPAGVLDRLHANAKEIERQFKLWREQEEDAGRYYRWAHGDFVETQIRGGFTAEDIARVDFEAEPTPEQVARLEALGIPWTIGGPEVGRPQPANYTRRPGPPMAKPRSPVGVNRKLTTAARKHRPKTTSGRLAEERAKLDAATLSVRLDRRGLIGLIRDGRLKSWHETGTTSGQFDPLIRAWLESSTFDTPFDPRRQDETKSTKTGYKKASAAARLNPIAWPIHAYLTESKDDPAIGDRPDLEAYGTYVVRLKTGTKARTTYTAGDMLDASYDQAQAPSPVLNPDPQASGYIKGYAHAQVHGPVTVDDISSIEVAPNTPSEIREMLDHSGIPWSISRGDRQGRTNPRSSGRGRTRPAYEMSLAEFSQQAWDDPTPQGRRDPGIPKTGFPDLDRAIDDFMAEQGEDLDWYRDPRSAWGACEEVADQLTDFLKARGFRAFTTTDYVEAFYPDAKDSKEIGAGDFSYPEHAATEIYGLYGKNHVGTVTIDFTAAQYGFREFPKIDGGRPDPGAWVSIKATVKGGRNDPGVEVETSGPRIVYHLTDRADFKLDPKYAPELNSLAGGLAKDPPKGLFVTERPESWFNGYDYVRPFVAEIEMPGDATNKGAFENEDFLPADRFTDAKVLRLIPTDEYVREKFRDYGWFEGWRDNRQPWDRLDLDPNYRYEGPDVREMAPEQVAALKKLTADYIADARPWINEDDGREDPGIGDYLYHETTTANLDAVLRGGLKVGVPPNRPGIDPMPEGVYLATHPDWFTGQFGDEIVRVPRSALSPDLLSVDADYAYEHEGSDFGPEKVRTNGVKGVAVRYAASIPAEHVERYDESTEGRYDPGVPVAIDAERKPWEMSARELAALDWETPASHFATSLTPVEAFRVRKEGEFRSLRDLALTDTHLFGEASGIGYSYGFDSPMSLIPVRRDEPLTVFRAVEAGRDDSLLPGDYVTESLDYAMAHGEGPLGGQYRLESMSLRPSELEWLGDPHEFRWIPTDAVSAHRTIIEVAREQGHDIPAEIDTYGMNPTMEDQPPVGVLYTAMVNNTDLTWVYSKTEAEKMQQALERVLKVGPPEREELDAAAFAQLFPDGPPSEPEVRALGLAPAKWGKGRRADGFTEIEKVSRELTPLEVVTRRLQDESGPLPTRDAEALARMMGLPVEIAQGVPTRRSVGRKDPDGWTITDMAVLRIGEYPTTYGPNASRLLADGSQPDKAPEIHWEREGELPQELWHREDDLYYVALDGEAVREQGLIATPENQDFVSVTGDYAVAQRLANDVKLVGELKRAASNQNAEATRQMLATALGLDPETITDDVDDALDRFFVAREERLGILNPVLPRGLEVDPSKVEIMGLWGRQVRASEGQVERGDEKLDEWRIYADVPVGRKTRRYNIEFLKPGAEETLDALLDRAVVLTSRDVRRTARKRLTERFEPEDIRAAVERRIQRGIDNQGMRGKELAAYLRVQSEARGDLSPAEMRSIIRDQIERLVKASTPGVDEVLDTGYMHEILDAGHVAIRVPGSAVHDIARDKRLRNQHETDTSRGALDQALRRNVEQIFFGIPYDSRAADRPVYGYLEGSPFAADTGQYGDIKFVLRDDVRTRSTFYWGDTLDNSGILIENVTSAPQPLEAPTPWALPYYGDEFETDPYDSDASYIEIQIHGGVSFDDVEWVETDDPNYAKVLKNAGLTVVGMWERPDEDDLEPREFPEGPAIALARQNVAALEFGQGRPDPGTDLFAQMDAAKPGKDYELALAAGATVERVTVGDSPMELITTADGGVVMRDVDFGTVQDGRDWFAENGVVAIEKPYVPLPRTLVTPRMVPSAEEAWRRVEITEQVHGPRQPAVGEDKKLLKEMMDKVRRGESPVEKGDPVSRLHLLATSGGFELKFKPEPQSTPGRERATYAQRGGASLTVFTESDGTVSDVRFLRGPRAEQRDLSLRDLTHPTGWREAAFQRTAELADRYGWGEMFTGLEPNREDSTAFASWDYGGTIHVNDQLILRLSRVVEQIRQGELDPYDAHRAFWALEALQHEIGHAVNTIDPDEYAGERHALLEGMQEETAPRLAAEWARSLGLEAILPFANQAAGTYIQERAALGDLLAGAGLSGDEAYEWMLDHKFSKTLDETVEDLADLLAKNRNWHNDVRDHATARWAPWDYEFATGAFTPPPEDAAEFVREHLADARRQDVERADFTPIVVPVPDVDQKDAPEPEPFARRFTGRMDQHMVFGDGDLVYYDGLLGRVEDQGVAGPVKLRLLDGTGTEVRDPGDIYLVGAGYGDRFIGDVHYAGGEPRVFVGFKEESGLARPAFAPPGDTVAERAKPMLAGRADPGTDVDSEFVIPVEWVTWDQLQTGDQVQIRGSSTVLTVMGTGDELAVQGTGGQRAEKAETESLPPIVKVSRATAEARGFAVVTQEQPTILPAQPYNWDDAQIGDTVKFAHGSIYTVVQGPDGKPSRAISSHQAQSSVADLVPNGSPLLVSPAVAERLGGGEQMREDGGSYGVGDLKPGEVALWDATRIEVLETFDFVSLVALGSGREQMQLRNSQVLNTISEAAYQRIQNTMARVSRYAIRPEDLKLGDVVGKSWTQRVTVVGVQPLRFESEDGTAVSWPEGVPTFGYVRRDQLAGMNARLQSAFMARQVRDTDELERVPHGEITDEYIGLDNLENEEAFWDRNSDLADRPLWWRVEEDRWTSDDGEVKVVPFFADDEGAPAARSLRGNEYGFDQFEENTHRRLVDHGLIEDDNEFSDSEFEAASSREVADIMLRLHEYGDWSAEDDYGTRVAWIERDSNGWWRVDNEEDFETFETAREAAEKADEWRTEALERRENSEERRWEFAQIFEGEWGDFEIEGESEVDFDGSIRFDGRIRHIESGEYAGEIRRTLSEEGLSVYHSLFQMQPEYQGQGLGSELLRHSLVEYEKLGVQEVHVDAGLNVGGYAWARMGFEASESQLRALIDGVPGNAKIQEALKAGHVTQEQLDQFARDAEDGKIQHTYELAAYGVENAWSEQVGEPKGRIYQAYDGKWVVEEDSGKVTAFDTHAEGHAYLQDLVDEHRPMWIGKAALLGRGWHGMIDLSQGADAAVRRIEAGEKLGKEAREKTKHKRLYARPDDQLKMFDREGYVGAMMGEGPLIADLEPGDVVRFRPEGPTKVVIQGEEKGLKLRDVATWYEVEMPGFSRVVERTGRHYPIDHASWTRVPGELRLSQLEPGAQFSRGEDGQDLWELDGISTRDGQFIIRNLSDAGTSHNVPDEAITFTHRDILVRIGNGQGRVMLGTQPEGARVILRSAMSFGEGTVTRAEGHRTVQFAGVVREGLHPSELVEVVKEPAGRADPGYDRDLAELAGLGASLTSPNPGLSLFDHEPGDYVRMGSADGKTGQIKAKTDAGVLIDFPGAGIVETSGHAMPAYSSRVTESDRAVDRWREELDYADIPIQSFDRSFTIQGKRGGPFKIRQGDQTEELDLEAAARRAAQLELQEYAALRRASVEQVEAGDRFAVGSDHYYVLGRTEREIHAQPNDTRDPVFFDPTTEVRVPADVRLLEAESPVEVERRRQAALDFLNNYTGPSGETLDLTVTKFGDDFFNIEGDILGADGRKIGTIERVILPEQGVVRHDVLALHPEHQGRGFGDDFFRASVAAYRAAGFRRITLRAGDVVGGYVWAGRGAELPNYLSLNERMGVISRLAQRADGREVIEEAPVPQEVKDDFLARFDAAHEDPFVGVGEIARYGTEHTWRSGTVTMWLGKAFLMGAEYNAEYPL